MTKDNLSQAFGNIKEQVQSLSLAVSSSCIKPSIEGEQSVSNV
jgi:hypothetical protein